MRRAPILVLDVGFARLQVNPVYRGRFGGWGIVRGRPRTVCAWGTSVAERDRYILLADEHFRVAKWRRPRTENGAPKLAFWPPHR